MLTIKSLALLAIGAVIACNNNVSFAVDNIAGRYRCDGFDPRTQEKYTGEVILTASIDATNIYESREDESGSDYVYYGRGIVDKDMYYEYWQGVDIKNVAVVERGVSYYQIAKNGKLIGHWLVEDSDVVGTEDCTPLK